MRVFLIGAGAIARYHAAALARLPVAHAELSVADSSTDALAGFVHDVPHARPFTSAAAMLAEPPEPDDIVVVATPPSSHAELACMALATGRHVLCEKPLALNLEQAETMLRVARRHGRLLGCCSTRFLGKPTTEAVKRMLRDGALGRLYHMTFVNRWQRSRPGIEYQPGSAWFLDRSQSGGGVVMDWGPYDFAVLNDLLAPVRVEVRAAWMARPVTAVPLPPGTVFDVEEHAGASLRYHLPEGAALDVTYERSGCTHGGARVEVEIEGLDGAASWDWLMWKREGVVTCGHDRGGELVIETTEYREDGPIGYMDRPLHSFYRRVRGELSPAIVDERAVFNFACVRAIYDCAASGRPQSVAPPRPLL